MSLVARFNCDKGAREEAPEVDAFIADIEAVYAKHGLSISHEDGDGAFIIEPLSESNVNWLRSAMTRRMTPLARAYVMVISETLATLPGEYYKRNPDGSRTVADVGDLADILGAEAAVTQPRRIA